MNDGSLVVWYLLGRGLVQILNQRGNSLFLAAQSLDFEFEEKGRPEANSGPVG